MDLHFYILPTDCDSRANVLIFTDINDIHRVGGRVSPAIYLCKISS